MPILAACLLAAVLSVLAVAPVRAGDGGLLFRYEQRDYRVDDLPARLRDIAYAARLNYHQQMQQLADAALYSLYLDREAARRGMTRQEVAADLIHVTPPAPSEVRAFYDANKERLDMSFEQAREQIAQLLRQQDVAKQRDAILARVKADGGFDFLLPEPLPPPVDLSLEGFPRKGGDDAPVTIVEFVDYQCPRCRRAAAVFDRVLEEYGDRVALVLLDFPVNPSGISRAVAEGAVCAGRQGRFWDFHDMAFASQPALSHDSARAFAAELGLDEAEFARCLQDPETRAQVSRGEQQARRLGIGGTPAVYVNGRPLNSDHLYRDLVREVERIVGASSEARSP